MNCINEYLTKVINNCNYDITFSGDKQCTINKWAVKAVPYDQLLQNTYCPVLETEYVNTVDQEYNSLPEHIRKNVWRYYISSEVNHNIYQDNCPEKLFTEENDKYIYCLSAVYCIEAQDTYLFINGEVPLRVWINGELVAESQYLYHIKPYTILYKFGRGMSTILVEKSKLAEYSHINNQTFVLSINPLISMLSDNNKRFIDDSMFTSIKNSFYIVPDKAFFQENDQIGITVFERFYGEGQTDGVRLDFINCFGESAFSMEIKTRQRSIVSFNTGIEGVIRIEAHDLLENNRSGIAFIYMGNFNSDCKNLQELILEDKKYPAEIAEALEIYSEIPNVNTGCYKFAPEIMNERLYQFLFEKISELYSAVKSDNRVDNRAILGVFKKSALLFQKSAIDGGSIGYGIFLPRNFSAEKEYSLVVLGSYGYAASRYPLPVPYLIRNESEDSIILNVAARGDLENEFIYELELQKLINHTTKNFQIKRNNVYMIGVCIGAKTAFSMVLKMPDFFEGIALVFGPALHTTLAPYLPLYKKKLPDNFKTDDLKLIEMNEVYVKNANNLPVYHLSLMDDFIGNVASDLYITSQLKYCSDFCFYDFLHDEFDEIFNSQKLVNELIKNKKDVFPKEIKFTSYYRKYNKSYWIQIENKINFMSQSFLSAKIASEVMISVETDNIQAFNLLLSTVQMEIMHEINLIVNGQHINIQMGDYAKIMVDNISGNITTAVLNLNRDSFEALYFHSGIDVKYTGLKQVYLNKCVIIKPDYYKDDRRAYVRKMFTLLSTPVSQPIRFYNYTILQEDEADMDDLSCSNFILVANTKKISSFQQMIFDNAGIEIGADYLKLKDRTFQGEYFALIKCPNPVNVKYCTVLLLFNSDNMQQILTKEYACFQDHPMFESDVIIYNENKYFCCTESSLK